VNVYNTIDYYIKDYHHDNVYHDDIITVNNRMLSNTGKNLGNPAISKPNIPYNAPISSFTPISPEKSPNIMKSLNSGINSSVSTVKSSLSNLFSPVKESVGEALENNSLITVPVMIGLGILIVLLIIIIIFRNQVAFAFQVTWDKIKSMFQSTSSDPSNPPMLPDTPSIDYNAVQNIMPTKEVFNIADNKYRYNDSDALCKAYGAELATYDQVKDAWNKGADWCNYGWIKGQAAIYPTQESTYNKLQTGPEDQKGACGIPGINGGYFDNPELRFGVNCYGKKPAKSDADDRAQMKPHDMTNDAIEYDRKVQDYKHELNQIPLSPFNSTSWA
jgi:hypothetical protein